MEAKTTNAELELQLRNRRSVVLTIATRCGIKKPDDWTAFNSWMKSRSVLKKELHRYKYDELEILIKQMRGLERNYDNSSAHTGTKAWFHKNGISKPSAN